MKARDFEPAAMIVDYIREERERCAALIAAIPDNREFLLYCINAPCYPDELDDALIRFGELSPVDDFEDLM